MRVRLQIWTMKNIQKWRIKYGATINCSFDIYMESIQERWTSMTSFIIKLLIGIVLAIGIYSQIVNDGTLYQIAKMILIGN